MNAASARPRPSIAPRNRLILPGEPGWDEPPRSRRGRSGWWQRLLSGRAAWTAFGGAWGSCCCSGGGGYTCGSCTIPQTNLTVDYTNLILGNGSATLVYSSSPTTQWESACTNQLLYLLVCTQNQVEFRVYYFVSGSCPTGQSQYCSTIRSNPFRLVQTSLTCSPSFDLECDVTGTSCPNLSSNGYTHFSVHP